MTIKNAANVMIDKPFTSSVASNSSRKGFRTSLTNKETAMVRACSSSSILSSDGQALKGEDGHSSGSIIDVEYTEPSAEAQRVYRQQIEAVKRKEPGDQVDSKRLLIPVNPAMSIESIREVVSDALSPALQTQTSSSSAEEVAKPLAPALKRSGSNTLDGMSKTKGLAKTSKKTKTASTKDVRFVEKIRLGAKGPVLTRVSTCCSQSDRCILYLPGGAFCCPAQSCDLSMAERLSKSNNATVFMVHYRVAPENPFPAGLYDCVCAYLYLIGRRKKCASTIAKRKTTDIYAPGKVSIVGSSAGGGLAFSLVQKLQQLEEKLPCAVIALSPWIDLALQGESYYTNEDADPVLSKAILDKFARYYCGADSQVSERKERARCSELASMYEQEMQLRMQPLVSPLYGDLSGFPPILIHVGQHEVLLDEAKALATKAALSGVEDVKIKVFGGATHCFQVVNPSLPESAKSLDEIASFINDATLKKELKKYYLTLDDLLWS
mmetsp:Transcript_4721/g.16938  ORF Transcript_4721/g.16938 Transcript_4721/m.16938 type:complete len:494 (+) Transcript_4721:87-1568(+)|eukprot:scaffold7377_cov389-Prasinococcus_capsulatus_cf.AAC.41